MRSKGEPCYLCWKKALALGTAKAAAATQRHLLISGLGGLQRLNTHRCLQRESCGCCCPRPQGGERQRDPTASVAAEMGKGSRTSALPPVRSKSSEPQGKTRWGIHAPRLNLTLSRDCRTGGDVEGSTVRSPQAPSSAD